jgi:hypothetical protein
VYESTYTDGRESSAASLNTDRDTFHHLLTSGYNQVNLKVGSRGLEIRYASILLCRS